MPQWSMPVTNTKQVLPRLIVYVRRSNIRVLVDFVRVAGSIAFLNYSQKIPGINFIKYLSLVRESHNVFEEVVLLFMPRGEWFAKISSNHVDGRVSLRSWDRLSNHAVDGTVSQWAVGFPGIKWIIFNKQSIILFMWYASMYFALAQQWFIHPWVYRLMFFPNIFDSADPQGLILTSINRDLRIVLVQRHVISPSICFMVLFYIFSQSTFEFI